MHSVVRSSGLSTAPLPCAVQNERCCKALRQERHAVMCQKSARTGGHLKRLHRLTQVVTADASPLQLLLNHSLCGNACMVHSRHPQNRPATHAVPPGKRVLRRHALASKLMYMPPNVKAVFTYSPQLLITTVCVAMPVWTIPGTHSTVLPLMCSHLDRVSCIGTVRLWYHAQTRHR